MRLPLKLQSNHSESTCVTSVTSNTEVYTCKYPKKTKVSGVRRIWGTLKSTIAFTVSSILKKLSTLGNKLVLRRKYINQWRVWSGRTQWWFVVKGSETDLEDLEKEWDRVQLQTGWKLENCYMTLSPLLPSNPESIHANSPEKHDETSAVADLGGFRRFRQNAAPFGLHLVVRSTDDRLTGTPPLSGYRTKKTADMAHLSML